MIGAGTRRSSLGTSLVEAVVALAVMAFGMLAVVAVQSTLRLNADVAKQRSEAIRIAQEAMEAARGFGVIDTPGAGQTAYADIASAAGVAVAGYTTNTTFTLTRTVVARTAPARKEINIRVDWTDRNGQAQGVQLNSIIAANDPRLSLLLGARPNGIPPRQPMGRHPAVPWQAIDIGGGQSALPPPAGGTSFWVVQNGTGVISSVCTYPEGSTLTVSPDNCIDQPSYLISGFVRFSFGPTPDATAPADEQIPLGMLALAATGEYGNGECQVQPVQDPRLTYTAYVCRVPLGADGTWTGTTRLGPPLDLDLYDVCRYTNDGVGNATHPQVYVHLDRSLANQNFLIVDQGVACPTGTLAHQPPL
jgi:Tfp pilus assembly protein PilV